jgi:hypothetical protein
MNLKIFSRFAWPLVFVLVRPLHMYVYIGLGNGHSSIVIIYTHTDMYVGTYIYLGTCISDTLILSKENAQPGRNLQRSAL